MPLSLTARTAISAAALLLAAGVFGARAQDTAQPAPPPAATAPTSEPTRNPTDVVARIGDQTITEEDLTLARQEFGSELEQIPQEQQRSALIDALVNMRLLAVAARDAKLDQGPEFEKRVEFIRMQALRNAYVEAEIVNSLTPDEIQKGYETLILSQHKPEEQIRARHILVETKEEAQKLIEELKGGAAFEELAKQSKDPSGQNGGDLGFFGKGQMVPPFEAAALALQPGAFTQEPVQSEFGWHVIKLEEKRMSEPPALAEVEGELRNYLVRQKFETVMADLRTRYAVEILGRPEGPGQPPADGAGDPASVTGPALVGDQPQTGTTGGGAAPSPDSATGAQPQ
ncbi:MAG: peptidylprolyl isomerase [Pseudomonadota bacterium]|nr:peptidylprolyl isomerase [Pseudomonadota bacterium]